jgi:hypothetical protein
MTETKLFTVRPTHGIYAGRTEDDLPIFASWGMGGMFVVVYFASDGAMEMYQEFSPQHIHYDKTDDDDENRRRYDAAFQSKLAAMGLVTVQPIRVQKFFITKHLIGIRQYPNALQCFLSQIEYTPEEVEALRELYAVLDAQGDHDAFSCFLVEEHLYGSYSPDDEEDRAFFEKWTAEDNYVLYCHNDFWCNADGVITAT